jgi:hypothetical protein
MPAIHVLSMRDEYSKRYPPEHWLTRAQEAWEKARALNDPEARHEMETVARLYERLAEFAKGHGTTIKVYNRRNAAGEIVSWFATVKCPGDQHVV